MILPQLHPLKLRAVVLSALLPSAAFFCAKTAFADVPLPPCILNPGSVAEAWNVIRLSTGNVGRLLQENRLIEIPEQISLCSPSLRLLARSPLAPEQKIRVDELTAAAFRSVNSIAQASMIQSRADAERAFGELQAALKNIAQAFHEKTISAEIYHCRTHPDIISDQDGVRCRLCDEPLIVRRIPYSFIYVQPGPPTLKLSVLSDAPLKAGERAEVRIRLQTLQGTPVGIADLLVMHGHPVHLLVTDPQLGDFHDVQPAATAAPGEFLFTFTPAADGPYRIWAEVVPVSTGLQEFLPADLGGEFKAGASLRTADSLSAAASGFHFDLSLVKGAGGQIRARQLQYVRLTVTDAAGQPFTRLEPLMNAFAYLVGFYEDHQTALRVHPVGGDILRDDLRGGPSLGFKIFPPKPGFMRFFCVVKVDGKVIAASLSVNVIE